MLIDGARSSSFFQREDLVRASTITSAINHKNPKKSQTPKITRGAPNTCLPRFCLKSCGLQKWMLANGCDWIRAVSGSIWVFEFLNIISPPYCMNTMNACKWLWLVEEGIGFRSTIPRLNSQGADLPAVQDQLQNIIFAKDCLPTRLLKACLLWDHLCRLSGSYLSPCQK